MDKRQVEIDNQLTTENCEGKGYEWVGDVVYDVSAPDEVNDEVFEHLDKGYVLGLAASRGSENYVGLYGTVKNS